MLHFYSNLSSKGISYCSISHVVTNSPNDTNELIALRIHTKI